MIEKRSGNRGVTRRSVLQATVAGAAFGAMSGATLFGARAQSKRLEGKVLEFLVTQPRIGAANKLAEMFEASTGCKLNITAIPYDAAESQATLDVNSGANRYDVFDYWYASIGALSTNGIIQDVTDRIERDSSEIKQDDFLSAFYDVYTLYDGRRWGLPWDGDTHSLYYNKALLNKHGLAVPVTWDDYLNVAKTITEAEKAAGIYGAIVMGVNIPVALGSLYVNRLAGFGGSLLTDDGKSGLLLDASIKAANSLHDVIPYALPTPSEIGFENGIPAFISGRGALIEFWTDLGISAQDPAQSKIVDQWGVTSLPVGDSSMTPRAAMDAGWGLALSAGSKDPDLAWEFMKFATAPETQLQVSTTPQTFSDPVRSSVLESQAYKDYAPLVQAAFERASKSVLPWPTIPQSPVMMRTLTDELSKMMAGQQTPEQTLENADAQWQRLLG
ncbi:ABC transporter substrate-binding protein [Borborobacter arsenicus]|nr:sugar ABC transporter substrate-binding protein [Pseudaminobacter arsenicus]